MFIATTVDPHFKRFSGHKKSGVKKNHFKKVNFSYKIINSFQFERKIVQKKTFVSKNTDFLANASIRSQSHQNLFLFYWILK